MDAPTKTQSIEIDFSEFNADELDRLIAGEDALRVIADSRERRKSEGATGKGVIAEAGIATPL